MKWNNAFVFSWHASSILAIKIIIITNSREIIIIKEQNKTAQQTAYMDINDD